MTDLERAITEIVERVVVEKIAALGQFKRPSDFRIEAGLSVAQAAQISGVSSGTIRRYERGLDEKAVLLARGYRCDTARLLESIRKQH